MDIVCKLDRIMQLSHTLTHLSQSFQNEAQYVSRFEAKINLELGRKVVEKIMVLPQVSKAIVLCGTYTRRFTIAPNVSITDFDVRYRFDIILLYPPIL